MSLCPTCQTLEAVAHCRICACLTPLLRWTKTLPTEPGFYWFKPRGTPVINPNPSPIIVDYDNLIHYVTEEDALLGLWAGPIPEPLMDSEFKEVDE